MGFVYSTFSELCNILVRNILVRNIFVRNIRNIKDLPLFYFKGNSFVLYTKFCDPQFFWYAQIFFRFLKKKNGIFSDVFGTPDFFSNFLSKIWYFLRFLCYPQTAQISFFKLFFQKINCPFLKTDS